MRLSQVSEMIRRIAVVGGAGHIGLPLAVRLASFSEVLIVDTNEETVNLIFQKRKAPFMEAHLEEPLNAAIDSGRLRRLRNLAELGKCSVLIVCVGTPVDAYLRPDLSVIKTALSVTVPHLPNSHRTPPIVAIRSTMPVGATRQMIGHVEKLHPTAAVVYCPERAMQGQTLADMANYPQILASDDQFARMRMNKIFSDIAPAVSEVKIEEAELVKLFTNNYRYMHFSLVNEMWRAATSINVDYKVVEGAMKLFYPPLRGMPHPGFAAGACLRKDALMTTNAFPDFEMIRVAFWANESLPDRMVDMLESSGKLQSGMCVGVCGYSFKKDNDDTRDSLGLRLISVLENRGYVVRCTDPYVAGERNLPLNKVLEEADLVIIGTNHACYASIEFPADVPVVDIWGLLPPQEMV